MRRNNIRPAVTLMEVLVAIFILSIGMVSVMAFFPIGALNMARSIRDQRTGQLATNSNAILHTWWKDSWVSPDNPFILPDVAVTASEPIIAALDTDPLTGFGILRADTGPSHPVMIDPLGLLGGYGDNVGGFVARRHFSSVFQTNGNRLAADRLCALADDISYDKNGEPANKDNTGQLDRGYRYTCAWVIQRERNSNPYDVRVYTLVFDNRPLDLVDGDQVYSTTNSSLIASPADPFTVAISTAGPPLPKTRKGGWVMMAFHYQPNPTVAPRWVVSFHRVVSQEDNLVGANNVRTLALEQQFSSPVNPDEVRLVVFEKLAEVFDRGTMSVLDRSK